MHEGHFTEKIVEVILEQLKNYPDGKILEVNVKVGETYHLVLDSVLMHFQIAVKGTRLEGTKLNIREEPVRVICNQCHKTGTVEDHHMLFCSHCDSLDVKIISGNTIIVESIKFEG